MSRPSVAEISRTQIFTAEMSMPEPPELPLRERFMIGILPMTCATLFILTGMAGLLLSIDLDYVFLTALLIGIIIAATNVFLVGRRVIKPEAYASEFTKQLRAHRFSLAAYDDQLRTLDGSMAYPIAVVVVPEGAIRFELKGPVKTETVSPNEPESIVFHEGDYSKLSLRRPSPATGNGDLELLAIRRLNPDERVTVYRHQTSV